MRSLVLLLCTAGVASSFADISITRSSKGGVFAPGDLIFAEEFDTFDHDLWSYEINMDEGGGNRELQIYDSYEENSYVRNGSMYIRPSLSLDTVFNGNLEEYYNGNLTLKNCTGSRCSKQGNYPCVHYPAVSARLRTKGNFAFVYGKVEARARIPSGDWTWPAIWLMPEEDKYGDWPKSGEIDLLEARGNKNLRAPDGTHLGVEQTMSTLMYGPSTEWNGYFWAHKEVNMQKGQGLHMDYHLYGFEWTESTREINSDSGYMPGIRFFLDNVEILNVQPPEGGFYELGRFPPNETENPWVNGTNYRMAPYDQMFHFIINVAVGGAMFPIETYPTWPPWANEPFLDFFNARDLWLPTWVGEEHAMAIDYIRVYAV